MHAVQVKPDEELLHNLDSFHYTSEIDEALGPHTDTLRNMLEQGWESFPDIPACRATLEAKKKASTQEATTNRDMVREFGELDVIEQCQINNWIANHVPGARETPFLWQGKPMNAHAATLVIAKRHLQEIKLTPAYPHNPGSSQAALQYVLDEAWEYQMSMTNYKHADVDLEALTFLEQGMFENAAIAGIAGYDQWGLDAGDHQDYWNPYEGLPSHWRNGGFEPDNAEELLQVGISPLI